MTGIPTDEGKLYLATVLDMYSRRLLGYPTSCHPDAELACEKIGIQQSTGRLVFQQRRVGIVFLRTGA